MFYDEKALDFVKCLFFFCLSGHDCSFLSFILLPWYIGWVKFHMLDQACIPVVSPSWSKCIIIFICYLIEFTRILLRIFASVIIREIGLAVFCSPGVWLWHQCNSGFIEGTWKCSLSCCLLEEYLKDSCRFSFKHLVEITMKPSGPGFTLKEVFLLLCQSLIINLLSISIIFSRFG